MIYHIVEQSCYQKLTNGLTIPNVAKELGIGCKTYSVSEFLAGQIDKDSSEYAVFITESAFLRNRNEFSLSDLRRRIPNGKIVNLGSDSILFNLQNKDEFGDIKPENIDLWLDTMEFSAKYYQDKGLKTDIWKWTISEDYIKQIEQLNIDYTKDKDYVCLARLNSPYRKRLKQNLDTAGLLGTFGDGTISSELEDLYKLYSSSFVAIGTTSPAGLDDIRTMKGFRDWIAPFFGTLLIYDRHDEMAWAYESLFTYDYDNFSDLETLILSIEQFTPNVYNGWVEKQKKFIRKHTLEEQFIQLFNKHDIVR